MRLTEGGVRSSSPKPIDHTDLHYIERSVTSHLLARQAGSFIIHMNTALNSHSFREIQNCVMKKIEFKNIKNLLFFLDFIL